MIFFMAEGQFGNQLFQYAFLKTLQKENEPIVVTGFDDLNEAYESLKLTLIPKPYRWRRAFIFRIFKPLLELLSNLKMISTVTVDHESPCGGYTRESNSYTRTKGLFSLFTYVKLGFFQSETFFDPQHLTSMQLRSQFHNNADKILQSIPENAHKVFVHIRRGDYANYRVYGESTLLPLHYFKQQIDWFTEHRDDVFFIFLSDDPKFITKHFDHLPNKFISTADHFATDFAIMQKCQSAILSPSSFGWWGAFFMKDPDMVFTPRHWLGFHAKIDYQRDPQLHFATEVEL